MGKAEKLSPSPTYPKGGSKRTQVILEAVRRTDENAPIKLDETTETNRETSETDEKWRTVHNQRSNTIQKTNTHEPNTTMRFFGQPIPQDSKADGVHSHFPFGANDTRTKLTFPQLALEKSSPRCIIGTY